MKQTLCNLFTMRHGLFRRSFAFIMFSMLFIGITSSAFATTNEYAVAEVATLISDIQAGTYDEYILSEAGTYLLTEDLDLASNITVKAKTGLVSEPILAFTGNASTSTYLFDIQGAYSLTLQGIKLDGADAAAGSAIAAVVRARGDNCSVTVTDCELYNFTTANGVFRLENVGTALNVDNCFIHDCFGRAIRINNTDVAMGDISVTNTTFANITDDPVLHWVSNASSSVNNIVIDQCTFYNVGDKVFSLGTIIGNLTVTNCVFDVITAGITLATPGSSSTMDYNYVAGLGSTIEATITVTNSITTAPTYVDAASLDLVLTNAESLTGLLGGPIGDLRWAQASTGTVEVYNDAQTVNNGAGQIALAKSNKDAGKIYIILEGETQVTEADFIAAVAANKGAVANVTAAYTNVSLATNGIDVGTYYAYAVDGGSVISTIGTNSIIVESDAAPIAVVNTVQASGNSVVDAVLVQSNKETGFVYVILDGEAQLTIAELETAVTAGKGAKATVTAANTDISISVDGITPGDYYAYAVKLTDLSTKGTNAITITNAAPIVSAAVQSATDETGQTVNVQSSEAEGKVYIILDGEAQSTVAELEVAVLASKGSSATVTVANTDVALSTTGLSPGFYYAYAVDSDGAKSDIGTNRISITSSSITSKEYAAADAADLVADIEAGLYETYILTTSGGVYDVKDIDLSASVVVKAKEGLAEKPILSKTDNGSTYTHFFDVQTGDYTLEIEGLAFDGTSIDDEVDPAEEAMSGAVRMRGVNATTIIKDCEFYNFSTANGVVRIDVDGNAFTMDNCYVHDCYGRVLRIDKDDRTFGAISVTNTTFANITDDPVINWTTAATNSVSAINIDHCTFYNVGDHVFKMGVITGALTISNSVFDAITGGITYLTPGTSSTMDYCYETGIAGTIENITSTNSITTAPVYEDASTLKLTLQNAGSLIGSDEKTIGDPRWVFVNEDVTVSNEVQSVTNAAGQEVLVKSNKDAGSVYIILEGETQLTIADLELAVTANKGAKASVVAVNADVIVSAEGLADGTYYAYAVDGDDNLSDVGTNAISILDASIAVAVINIEQTVSNAKGQVALVQSNKPAGTVYMVLDGVAQATIAEIHAAITAGNADSATVTANATDMSIATDSLMVGMYYSYAVDADGNLSAKGTNAITVKKGAPEVYADAQTTSDAEEMFVTVQSSDSHGKVYIILDGIDQDSIPEFEAAVAAGKGAVDTVIASLTDVNLSTTGLAVGVYYAYATDSVGNVSAKGTNKLAVVSSTEPYKEYTVADLAAFEEDLSAGLYEYYILSTSGGLYDVSSSVDISKSAVIMAKAGLAEKPILKNSANTLSYLGVFRIRNTDELVELTLQGIEFDCEGDKGHVIRADVKTDLKVIDCYVHGNTNSNGSFRLGGEGSTALIENSFIANCKTRIINLYTNTTTYGDMVLRNSTFVNLSVDAVVCYRSAGQQAAGTSLLVDHCTFSEIGGDVFFYDKALLPDGITVQNCLFDQVKDSLNADVLDYNYLDVELLAADAGTNTFTTAPVFVDSAMYNYGLTNKAAYVCADGETVGDLNWYVEADSLIAIMYPQKTTNLEGDVLKAQANVATGTLYILRDDVASTTVAEMDAAVVAKKGNSAALTAANTNIEFSVTGLYSGTYYAYVVGANGVISSASEFSAIVFDWLNIQYPEQTVTNGVGKTVAVVTSVDGVAYLVKEGDYVTVEDLDAAVTGGRGVKGDAIGEEELILSVEDLQVGTYYGYAVSDTNVSLRGENAVIINTAIFVDSKSQTATNVEGAWAHAYVQGGTVASSVYLMNDSVPFEILTKEILDAAVASQMAVKDTVKVAEQDIKMSTVGLEAGNYHYYLVLGEQISERGNALVKVRQPKRYYFSAEQAEEMRSAFYMSSITTGDEVILTSSGGVYNITTYFRIFGGVTLRAENGLAEKPVLLYNPTSGGNEVKSFMPLIEFYPPGGLLHIKGIELDGGAADELSGNATYATRIREDADFNYGCAVVFEDCDIHDFNTKNTNSSGVESYDGYVLRQSNNTLTDSIVFDNCIIKDILKPAIDFRNTVNKDYFKLLKVENCTFNQVSTVLNVSAPIAETTSLVQFNHCTFDSIGTDTSIARIILPDNLPNLQLSNSLITSSASQTASDTALMIAANGMLTNCNFFTTSMVISHQTQVSNTTYLDPAYYDRANFNYAITETALLTSASAGKQVGDLRWEATSDFMVNASMLYVNSTTLKLIFNQSVDTVTAKIVANYALSGTVGLTGAPESVTLVAPNAVELVVGDISGAIDFSTVIVTVSNVTNVNGDALLADKNVATYISPIAVTMEEQEVGNEDVQFVEATCGSDNSTIYLVPEAAVIFTVSDLKALEAEGLASKATVTTASVNAEISVVGLEPGIYYAYAVDPTEEQWSARSANKVTVYDFAVMMPIQLGKTNAEGMTVIAQSTFKNASIYLVKDELTISTVSDLDAAVTANDGRKADVVTPFTDLLISIEDINAGKYRAYAVWGDSVSVKTGGTVQINEAVGVDTDLESEIKIYAYDHKAIVQLEAMEQANVVVYAITGSIIEKHDIISTRTEFALKSGMYILRVETAKGIKTQRVVID